MATIQQKRERMCRADGHDWIESVAGTIRYCARCKHSEEVTPAKDDNPVNLAGQQLRVFNLISGRWVCGTEFLALHMPRYAARIWELKAKGYLIEKRKCVEHIHPQSQQYQWRLIHAPGA